MALHQFFEDQTKRQYFEAAFDQWYERTRKQLQAIKNDPETFAWSGPSYVADIQAALEKTKKRKTDASQALEIILDVREAISQKVGSLAEQTEKFYGPQTAIITMNTNMHLNGLSPNEKVTLLEHFNLVKQTSNDHPNIISFAQERAKRDIIGPQLPLQQQQEASPAAQMG